MVHLETVYGYSDSLTPDIAAKLSQCAEHFQARTHLECGDKRVRLDSLIGILSVECRRGSRLTVTADGVDAQAAAEAVCRLLGGA